MIHFMVTASLVHPWDHFGIRVIIEGKFISETRKDSSSGICGLNLRLRLISGFERLKGIPIKMH